MSDTEFADGEIRREMDVKLAELEAENECLRRLAAIYLSWHGIDVQTAWEEIDSDLKELRETGRVCIA